MRLVASIIPAMALCFALGAGCGSGSGTSGGTGGTQLPPTGTGGSAADGALTPRRDASQDAVPDHPLVPSDVASPIDVPPSEAGAVPPIVQCTGLTSLECHLLIINPDPVTLPELVLPQETGPNPAVPYPTCSAI